MTLTKQQIDQWVSDVDYWRKKYADLGLQYDALVHKAAQPDCRNCRYHHELGCHQYMSNMRDTARHCVNGDKYIEAPKVVLWRTK